MRLELSINNSAQVKERNLKNKITALLIVSLTTSCTIVGSENNTKTPSKSSDPLLKSTGHSPISIPVSFFIDPNKRQLKELVIKPISAQEEAKITEKLATLPKFPSNSYSGCHARAHFDYTQLKNATDEKTYKIWLLSSSLLSPALGGAITFIPENGNKTSWDYHVAVAYIDSNGNEWVIDRLISDKPILVNEWTNRFDIEGYAVLTRVQPQNYLFNKTEIPASDPVNYPDGFLAHFVPKNVFNGTFYQYSGKAAEEHWGASDLAADSLSHSLQSGEFSSCSWVNIASQALALKTEAVKNSAPLGCEGAKALYDEEFEAWIKLGL